MKTIYSILGLLGLLLTFVLTFASASFAAISGVIQQSTAAQPIVFTLVSSADGQTPLNGLTPTVMLSKTTSGVLGSAAAPAGAVTQPDTTNQPGVYQVAGNSADTSNLGILHVTVTAAGAVQRDYDYAIVAYNPLDASVLGLTGIATATNLATANTNINTANTNINTAVSQTTSTNQQSADAAALTAAGYTSSLATGLGTTNTTVAGLPSASANATAVWGAGTRTITGGSVGSVTGSVGSVTGSVGSVTGSVGSVTGITFPSNFGTFNIDGSGRVTLVPGQSTAASNLPSDYQQRGVAVTLPATAPSGYGGGSAPTLSQITGALLSTPGTPINNDSSGRVLLQPTQAFANSTAGTVTPTWYSAPVTPPTVTQIRQEMDANSTQFASIVSSQAAQTTALANQSNAIAALPNASAIASAVFSTTIYSGLSFLTAFQDIWATSAGPSAATRPDSTHQVTVYTGLDGSGQHTTTLTTNSSGQPVSRTVSHP